MTYSLVCQEASYDCSYVIQRNSEEEEEEMQKAGRHAQEAHEMQYSDFTSETTKKLRSLIRQT
jgi:predicted small metal-binding protein